MKFRLIYALATLLISTPLFAHQYDGDWQFVKGQYTTANGDVIHADNSELVAIKTVKGDKFALSNMKLGQFNGYLSGEFSVNGEHYSEITKAGTWKELVNKTFTFKGWLETKVENGQTVTYWHHKGMVNGTEENEVWRKLNK